jgi:TorA maturation chaperone TorD
MSHETAKPESRAHLRQASRWRFIGLLFERPRQGWLQEVRALRLELDDPVLRAAAHGADELREADYLRVFGPGGAVSPREVAYRPMHDPGRILAELSGYYRAFGYHPRHDEPLDHIAVETGFVAWLALKEAYAHFREEAQGAGTARAARRTFVDEHLATFVSELAGRLVGAGLQTLAEAAALLHTWCGGSAGSPRPSLPIVGEGGRGLSLDPEACGSCAGISPPADPAGPPREP